MGAKSGAGGVAVAEVAFFGFASDDVEMHVTKWAGAFAQAAADAALFVDFDGACCFIAHERTSGADFYARGLDTLQAGDLNMFIRRCCADVNATAADGIPIAFYHGAGELAGTAPGTL